MTIYFIEDGDAVKIGFTEDTNPKKRLRALQTGNPRRLTLLGFVPGTIQDEREIHDDLKPYRLEGEWFSLTPPVILYIDQCMKRHGIKKAIKPRASKPQGFSSCKISDHLTKAQQKQLLESKSRVTFIDTPDGGTIVGLTDEMKSALFLGEPLDCIKVEMKDSTQAKSGTEEWYSILKNWNAFFSLPPETQQRIVSAIVEDVYPSVRNLLLDAYQDPSTRLDLIPLLPVIRFAGFTNKKDAVITLDAYSKRTYLSDPCQAITDEIAKHGTFPLAISVGKDEKGHDRFIFTPIDDNQMTWLGWH